MKKRRKKKQRPFKKNRCQTKVGHKSEADAKYAIMKTLEKNFIFHKLKAYQCKHCGRWHIGRTKQISYTRFEELLNKKSTEKGP
jgi:hypothetical protein